MYNKKISIVVSSMIFGLMTLHAETSDLGTIQVESTTIDDKIESKKNEPSSVATVSGEKVEESKAENVQKNAVKTKDLFCIIYFMGKLKIPQRQRKKEKLTSAVLDIFNSIKINKNWK